MTANAKSVIASRRSSDFAGLGSPTAVTTGHVEARSEGSGPIVKTTLTLTSVPVTIVDEAGVTGYGGIKLYDFPAGAVLVLGAVTDLDVTESGATSATFDGDVALGTVTATNTALASKTGGDAENNIIPYTTMPQAASSVTTANATSVKTITALTNSTGRTPDDTLANHADLSTYGTDAAVIEQNVADLGGKINELVYNTTGVRMLLADGTSTAIDLYLNFLVDDADQAGGTLTVSGTITFVWINLGDI